MHRSKRTQTLITLLKILLAAGILTYLVVRLESQSGFTKLRYGTKDWWLLLGAAGLVTIGFSLSFVRWVPGYIFLWTPAKGVEWR